jgi:hypothetical protein
VRRMLPKPDAAQKGAPCGGRRTAGSRCTPVNGSTSSSPMSSSPTAATWPITSCPCPASRLLLPWSIKTPGVEIVRDHAGRVKRWSSGEMALGWTGERCWVAAGQQTTVGGSPTTRPDVRGFAPEEHSPAVFMTAYSFDGCRWAVVRSSSTGSRPASGRPPAAAVLGPANRNTSGWPVVIRPSVRQDGTMYSDKSQCTAMSRVGQEPSWFVLLGHRGKSCRISG